MICPADANETVEAVKAIAAFEGPCYLRLNRNEYENVTPEGKKFQIGKPYVMKEGDEIAICATGYMVGEALAAAEVLKDEISVRVINVPTIKPIDEEVLISLLKGCRGIVTAEEHTVRGGLGSAVAEILRKKPVPMEFVGIKDVFGCSAHSYRELLEYYELTADAVAGAVRSIAGI